MTARWSKFRRRIRPFSKSAWTFLNSPLFITLVSGLVIAAITRNYAEQQDRIKDVAERRGKLAAALTEYQQRIGYLVAGDKLWTDRCKYARASEVEWEALTGTGAYLPTAPQYRNVNFSIVINDIEVSSGVGDLRYGTNLMLGTFSHRPPDTAIWLRSVMPWLTTYGSTRAIAMSTGGLPLPQGYAPDESLDTLLELPGSTPALLRKLERENDESHRQLQETIKALEKSPPKPCPAAVSHR